MTQHITPDELKRLFPYASASALKRNAQTDRVAPNAEQKRDPGHEPMGKSPRKAPYPGKRLVRLTSYRRRRLDERNLWDHYFVDALVESGVLFDDSPPFVKVEVRQVVAPHFDIEWTEIEVYDL